MAFVRWPNQGSSFSCWGTAEKSLEVKGFALRRCSPYRGLNPPPIGPTPGTSVTLLLSPPGYLSFFSNTFFGINRVLCSCKYATGCGLV